MPAKGQKGGFKMGGLSKDERLYIEKFLSIKSDEELGKELKRSPNQVNKYRRELEDKQNTHVDVKEKDRYLDELRKHTHYENLQKQFTKEEFINFEAKYVGMLFQFKEVTFTEQEQIFTYITTSIYVDRLNEEKLQILRDVNKLNMLLDKEYNKVDKKGNPAPLDTDMIMNLQGQISSLSAASSSKTQEYQQLTKRQDDIMKNLKGTREQRIKKVEDSKISFIGLMKFLDDEDNRKEVGIEMLLNEAAMNAEKKRLGGLHTFADGDVDRPLLSSDTAKETTDGQGRKEQDQAPAEDFSKTEEGSPDSQSARDTDGPI